jgi:hypothetical protein
MVVRAVTVVQVGSVARAVMPVWFAERVMPEPTVTEVLAAWAATPETRATVVLVLPVTVRTRMVARAVGVATRA